MEPAAAGRIQDLQYSQRLRRGQAPHLRGGHGPHQGDHGPHRGGCGPHHRGDRGPHRDGPGYCFRDVGERGRGQDHRLEHRQQEQRVSNKIQAIVLDYAINHGMTISASASAKSQKDNYGLHHYKNW